MKRFVDNHQNKIIEGDIFDYNGREHEVLGVYPNVLLVRCVDVPEVEFEIDYNKFVVKRNLYE